MTYLLSFSPWIAYAALSSADWRIAVGAAAVLAAALVVRQIRKHDLDLLTGVTLAFFAAMTAVALAAPHSGLHRWTPALSAATLAVVALVSLAIGRPFTLGIARRSTPKEYWTSPLFIRTNTLITSVWAAAFVASATACALIIHFSPASSLLLIVVQVAAFVAPMLFTKNYTDRIKKARAAGSGPAAATAA